MAGIESYANQYQKSTEKKGMIRDESGKFESNISSFVETEIGDATVITGGCQNPIERENILTSWRCKSARILSRN